MKSECIEISHAGEEIGMMTASERTPEYLPIFRRLRPEIYPGFEREGKILSPRCGIEFWKIHDFRSRKTGSRWKEMKPERKTIPF